MSVMIDILAPLPLHGMTDPFFFFIYLKRQLQLNCLQLSWKFKKIIVGSASADLGTRTTSLRVPFGHSQDSRMYSSVIFDIALVMIFNTRGCLFFFFFFFFLEMRSIPGLNDFDNITR
ncbi:uncharacterized protein B0P05DRAFT_531141 [Gilbertella persicaria]|uniref:uncharacterized protein n=1 Tax=Gilbertella persicaria TaxID=101096 RepID=UPI002220E195|nr:uncharacterized protein B0P05DRAFT_531141 [Gilbertella persicaria]KAI8088017.1 hypothetical protein B0P05DRAFT_531141 [Gilbertella persicaria]